MQIKEDRRSEQKIKKRNKKSKLTLYAFGLKSVRSSRTAFSFSSLDIFIWIFLSFYTSISAIHVIFCKHISYQYRQTDRHLYIMHYIANARVTILCVALFWIEIIKMTLHGKNEVENRILSERASKQAMKQKRENKVAVYIHISRNYGAALWIGSWETRPATNSNTNRSECIYANKKLFLFYLPCKFTVQVVLLPRSNTTTLVAAAIVSAQLDVIVRSLVRQN